MEMLTDPTVFGALKVVGSAIAILMALPFIVGIIIGWIIGRAM
jgi:hypothetical protein